jgi:hypothetical protein
MATDQLLPDEAVRAIQDSVRTETIEVNGDLFTTRQVFLPPAEPQAQGLKLHTLSGLVEYVQRDMDAGLENGAVVHVLSHNHVQVISSIDGRHKRRDVFATAQIEDYNFSFDAFLDCETFIIGLQSHFDVKAFDAPTVLKIVGNIKQENVRTASDDGVTQSVVARTGIAKVAEVEVPNPVELRPFRTFLEVEQPSSTFVLRMRQGREGQLPTCALFEADGGKWKLRAIENIRDYLKAELVEGITVIA